MQSDGFIQGQLAAGQSLNKVFVGAVAVNAFDQGALRRFTHWPWIKYPTFQLGGGQSTTEVIVSAAHAKTKTQLKLICQIFHFVYKIQKNFTI